MELVVPQLGSFIMASNSTLITPFLHRPAPCTLSEVGSWVFLFEGQSSWWPLQSLSSLKCDPLRSREASILSTKVECTPFCGKPDVRISNQDPQGPRALSTKVSQQVAVPMHFQEERCTDVPGCFRNKPAGPRDNSPCYD